MQRAADSSALAGASGLLLGSQPVYQRAIEVAGQNPVIHDPVLSGELSIATGDWEAHQRTFTPRVGNNPITPNAVHVTGTRTGIELLFARVFGFETTMVQKDAVAVFGAGTCAGLWGLEGITCDGSIVTDSYDSSQGVYGPGNVHPNGDVCSCQDLEVNGAIQIHGDAMYGHGYAFDPSGNAYSVWGSIDDHLCGVPPFVADFAAASATNDNADIGLTDRGRDPFNGSPWDLYVTGTDSLTLNGGTYYFNSVLIDGQATLSIAGPTIMFVDGPADFTGGGIFNISEHPPDLVIYAAGPNVNLKGGSAFYGAVIAPNADITMEGTSDVYGTLVGRTLDFNGDTVIHVDEALVFGLFGIDASAQVIVK
jgi:hypothetical protein